MRQYNQTLLLRMLWAEDDLSRAEISRRTGLSRSTVSDIVGELIGQGLVAESHLARSRGGRPPMALRFRECAARVVGIEMGAGHVHTVLTDLRGNVLAETSVVLDVQASPKAALRQIERDVRSVLDQGDVPIEGVVGIGIAVPCPLHPDRPDQLLPRILPAWADVRLSLHLEEVFGRPVFIDNDANLGALAEAWWGPGIGRGDVAFVKLDVGVGAGLLVDGEVYHGASGVAGEIGHTAIDPRGPLCRCGLSGCLEAMVGSDSLLGQYPGEDRPPSIAALVDAAEGGDADADRLITSAGRNLGVALANLMNLLNPSVVVLSGPLTHAGERLLVPLRAAMTERALWTSVADVDLLISPLGPAGIARGAAALVLQTALERPTLFREAQLETPQLEEPCVP